MQENINKIIGDRLKTARKAKGWSLDVTADKTGVSKAMLGQIERGESNPTITTLWKIAIGLEQSFSSFLTQSGTITKVSDNQLANFPGADGIQFNLVFPYQQDTAMETYQLTMAPGFEQQSEAHSKGVIEHIIVIKGCISLWFNQQWHQLTAGQSIRFNADQPHAYVNSTQEEAEFYDVICYSEQGKL